MKGLKAAALLAPAVVAIPSPWMRDLHTALAAVAPNAVLARLGLWNAEKISGVLEHGSQTVITTGHNVLTSGQRTVKQWTEHGREFIQKGENLYERIAHPSTPALADYQLRLTLNETGELASPNICDNVKQRAGYLDISDDRHLFFWFFEARNDPEDAPLLLWLNGGPGCSSSTGLLMELGPCLATQGGGTKPNPHSWNTNFHNIYLDQPVDVGFSYRSGGGGVNNSPAAAEDVWAFLQLFVKKFPQYAHKIHLAAESYGGHYAPNIAAVIHKHNLEIKAATVPTNLQVINLASVILANGLSEPKTQMASVPDFACDGPFHVFDPESQECASLRSKAATCERLVQSCYNNNSRFTCVPAALYCWSQMFGSFQQLGLNPYDVRRKCDKDEDGPLCYREMGYIEEFLNLPETKKALGAEEGIKFESCNMEVNQAFMFQGDGMHNSAALLPTILDAGIRVLVYAGNADCTSYFLFLSS